MTTLKLTLRVRQATYTIANCESNSPTEDSLDVRLLAEVELEAEEDDWTAVLAKPGAGCVSVASAVVLDVEVDPPDSARPVEVLTVAEDGEVDDVELDCPVTLAVSDEETSEDEEVEVSEETLSELVTLSPA